VLGYVLGDFDKADMDWLLPCLDAVADNAVLLATGKPEDFMSHVARLTKGPEQKDGV
jgi:PTH1 family peptidyl-tRNA hydrolase